MLHTNVSRLDKYYLYKFFLEECKCKKYSKELVLHKHHIIPKSLWLTSNNVNNIKNIIILSVEDHIKAHLLLAEVYDVGSYEYICNMRAARILNKNSIKDKEILDEISNSYKGENNPFYGKTHSIEILKLIAENTRKMYENIDNYEQFYDQKSELEKEKRRIGTKNMWSVLTEEQRIKRSKNSSLATKGKNTGSKNPASYPLIVNGKRYECLTEALTDLQLSY